MRYFRDIVPDPKTQRPKAVQGLVREGPDGTIVFVDVFDSDRPLDVPFRAISDRIDSTHILHIAPPSVDTAVAEPEPQADPEADLSVLWTGVSVGIAANLLTIATGATMLQQSQTDRSLDILERADDRYQAGEFEGAIALAETVDPQDFAYAQTQATIDRWEDEWEEATQQFPQIRAAFDRQQWEEVLQRSATMPDTEYWQQQVAPWERAARSRLEMQASRWLGYAHRLAATGDYSAALYCLGKVPQNTAAYGEAGTYRDRYRQQQRFLYEQESDRLIAQAFDRAAKKDFTGALLLLDRIPPGTEAYDRIRPKLEEYRQKQQVRATWLLQQAYNAASQGDFSTALEFLDRVDRNTQAYAIARLKMDEYRQKQNS